MTLNLKPGDYARDKDGNVYGPLREKKDYPLLLTDGKQTWHVDGWSLSFPDVCLVAKVRPVTTYEDVPPPDWTGLDELGRREGRK